MYAANLHFPTIFNSYALSFFELSNFGVQKKAKIWGSNATKRVLTDNLDVQFHKVSEVPPSFPISPLQEVLVYPFAHFTY